jgi:L-arabinose isomerase
MMHMTGCMRQQYAQRFGKDTNLIVTSRQVDCNIFRQHRLPKVSLIVIDEPFLHGKKYMKSWHKTAKDLRVPVIHLGTMRRVNIED